MNIKKELEKDGVSASIFHLIWKKNEILNENIKINIPDTILYKYGKPVFWYYSTKDGVKRKKPENITNTNILNFFIKEDKKIGVVAVYLYNLQEPSSII